jgi:hypothetical protein
MGRGDLRSRSFRIPFSPFQLPERNGLSFTSNTAQNQALAYNQHVPHFEVFQRECVLEAPAVQLQDHPFSRNLLSIIPLRLMLVLRLVVAAAAVKLFECVKSVYSHYHEDIVSLSLAFISN